MAAIASLVLGLFSFALPATPPTRKGDQSDLRDMLGLEAVGLLKNRSYLVFFLSSIAICIPLAFYYNFTNLFLNEVGVRSAAAVQSLGQVSEVLFLLLMPVLCCRDPSWTSSPPRTVTDGSRSGSSRRRSPASCWCCS
jgi:amino acid transporter